MHFTTYHPFPNTHWSLVRRAGGGGEAGGGDGEARREALAVLLARYQPALRSHLIVIKRFQVPDADEIVQGFIADRLLGLELLKDADQKKGRFRTLLLTALNHYAVSRLRYDRVRRTEPLNDGETQEGGRVGAPAEAVVEAQWARTLVHNVLWAMRDECKRMGRQDLWTVFEGRVLAEIFGLGEKADVVSYEELAQRLGLATPTQAANLLVTGKRMFARMLRTAVAEYEMDEADIDAEIVDLRRILAKQPTASP